jgi:hypothetical protein
VLRNGYPTSRTLDDIITGLRPGHHRSFLGRMASLTIDGDLLRGLPYRNLTDHEREHRGARSFLEVLTLARGLAFLGLGNCIARRALQPDFEVTLPSGDNVGIEVTDAFRTAAYESRLQNLRLAVIDRLRADSLSLDSRLVMLTFRAVMETGVAMNLGGEPSVPDEAIPHKRADLDAFVSEFASWISAGEHRTDRRIHDEFSDARFQELTRWGVMLSSSDMTATHDGAFEILLPNVGQSAAQLRTTVRARIDEKRRKAPTYGLHRPLWLFTEIADRAVRAPRALEEIVHAESVRIAPFECVVIIHDGAAVALRRAGATRMDMASPNRDEPLWPRLFRT